MMHAGSVGQHAPAHRSRRRLRPLRHHLCHPLRAGSRPPRTLAQGCIGTRRCRRDADRSRPRPRVPERAQNRLCAMVTPLDGRATQKAAPAIAEAVRAKGGHILQPVLRGFETTAGRVSAVVTERGPIACEAAVIAGGVERCRQQGLRFPQLNILNAVIRTEPLAGGPEGAFWSEDFARKRGRRLHHRQRFREHCRSGAGQPALRPAVHRPHPCEPHDEAAVGAPVSGRDPMMWRADLDRPGSSSAPVCSTPALEALYRRLCASWASSGHSLRRPPSRRRAGYIDMTPDEIPVISPLDAVPGLFLASGFSGHGFGLGPGAGRRQPIYPATPPSSI